MISIAFFNTQSRVGKTSLVYHVGWMFEELGYRALMVDLDPQSHLSMLCLDEDRLEELWPDSDHPQTLFGAGAPLILGDGEFQPAHIEAISNGLGLLVGDLALSQWDELLASEWPRCLAGSESALRVTTAFRQIIREAAKRAEADVVLIDIGPHLSAVNRAALVAASHVVVPVASDLFCVQSLRNLGPTLRRWRATWRQFQSQRPPCASELPPDPMSPAGYVVMRQVERLGRPNLGNARWYPQISRAYRESVLGEPLTGLGATTNDTPSDPNEIRHIRHYRSLMPLALEARKPMFALRPADGAMGAYQTNVTQCYSDLHGLTLEIARRTGVTKPE